MTSANGQKLSFVPIKDEHGGPSHPAIVPPPHPDPSHMTSSGMVMSHHNDNNNGVYHGPDNGNRSLLRTPPPDLISDTLPKVRIDLPSHETTYRSENHAMTSIPKSEYPSGSSSSYHHHGHHHQRHGSSSHNHRKGVEQISPQEDVKFQPLQVDTNTGHHMVGHHGKMAQISPSAAQPHSCHASQHKSSRHGTLNVNGASSSTAHHQNSSSHHPNHHGSMHSHNSSGSHHHHGSNTMGNSSSNNNHKHRPAALNLGPPHRHTTAAGSSQHSPTVPSLALQTGQPVFLNNNLPSELHRFELVVVEFDLITF